LYALHLAVWYGNLELIKYFLNKGEDINLVSQKYCSPLMNACDQGYIHIVKYLLSKGAQINKHNTETALINAIHRGIKIVKVLVNNGALINETLINKHTPLWTSIRHNKSVITKYLIRHGAYIKFGNYHSNHITDEKLSYIKKIILKRIRA